MNVCLRNVKCENRSPNVLRNPPPENVFHVYQRDNQEMMEEVKNLQHEKVAPRSSHARHARIKGNFEKSSLSTHGARCDGNKHRSRCESHYGARFNTTCLLFHVTIKRRKNWGTQSILVISILCLN